jgi:hypothetical protein
VIRKGSIDIVSSSIVSDFTLCRLSLRLLMFV